MNHTATAKVTMNVNAQCIWQEIIQQAFAKAQFNVHRNGQLTQGHRNPNNVLPSWTAKDKTVAWDAISGYQMSIDDGQFEGNIYSVQINLERRFAQTKVTLEVEYGLEQADFFGKTKAYFYVKGVISEKLRNIKQEFEARDVCQETPAAALNQVHPYQSATVGS